MGLAHHRRQPQSALDPIGGCAVFLPEAENNTVDLLPCLTCLTYFVFLFPLRSLFSFFFFFSASSSSSLTT